jgi:hypothetical protein
LIIIFCLFLITGCKEPEVIIKTVVETVEKTVINTVVETVTVTVVETVEAKEETEEKTVEKPRPVPEKETDTISFSGSGDSIINIDKPDIPMVVHITGNSSSTYFSVTSYDKEGEYLELLVNTTETYDGIRSLDFLSGELTTRFEIKSTDEWTIEILPVSSVRVLSVPGSIEGKNDEVIKLSGGVPDLATISGNDIGGYFGIFTYNGFKDLIVNETEPYEGTVMLENDIGYMEIMAEDNWSIEITEK